MIMIPSCFHSITAVCAEIGQCTAAASTKMTRGFHACLFARVHHRCVDSCEAGHKCLQDTVFVKTFHSRKAWAHSLLFRVSIYRHILYLQHGSLIYKRHGLAGTETRILYCTCVP